MLSDPVHQALGLHGQKVELLKPGLSPAIVEPRGIARRVHSGHATSDVPANRGILQTVAGKSPEDSVEPPAVHGTD